MDKKNNLTKKQHYVPQMYLKNFSVNDRCFVYNPYTKRIENKNIRNICEENYLYEIRNDNGDFLFPETKNGFEKALSVIEGMDAKMLSDLLPKVQDSKDYVRLQGTEREELLGFIVLMLLRNPLVRNVLPEVVEEVIGREICKKEEVSVAWIFTMLNIDKVAPDIVNSEIVFMETTKSKPFITSSLPMSFAELSIHNHLYMPLSSTVAIELIKPKYAVIDLNICKKRKLDSGETEKYNAKMLTWSEFIICSSESELKNCLSFMEQIDKSPVNPYVLANLEMIGNMPKKYVLRLVVKYIELELDENKTQFYIDTLKSLISKGQSEDDAKLKMAEAIEEEFKKAIFNNKRPDEDMCQKLLMEIK